MYDMEAFLFQKNAFLNKDSFQSALFRFVLILLFKA